MPTRPSPRSERLGTPNTPAIRFTRGTSFEASLVRQLLRPVRLLAPLDGSDWVSPATGGFYIQASDGSVSLTVAGYDYNRWGNGPARMSCAVRWSPPDKMEVRGHGVHQPQASLDGGRPWSTMPVWTCP